MLWRDIHRDLMFLLVCQPQFNNGDTVQLLTWIPESTAAAAAQATAAAAQPATTPRSSAPGTRGSAVGHSDLPGTFIFDEHRQAFAFQNGLTHNIMLQEEVEQWGARVKVWTCMLMLIYSFRLLVGMSQSLETHQQQSSEVALSFLGFWVAYIGLRGASRYNASLARGYLFGQIAVAVCTLFRMAVREPTATSAASGHDASTSGHDADVEVSANVLFLSFMIHVVFWSYIVYGAYRYQRALILWLQDGAPEHIVASQEDV